MKKIISIGSIVLMSILLVGLSLFLKGDNKENYKIIFIPKSQLSSFWKITIEGFENAINENQIEGRVKSTVTEEDILGQDKIVRDSVDEGYDAIIISANSYDGLSDAVNYGINNGVEIVVIDSDVKCDKIKIRISTDNYKAGYEMGQKTANLMDYHGKLGLLDFKTYTQNIEDRINGFKDAIKEYSGIKIVREEKILSTQVDAARGTNALLEAKENIDAIASFNEIVTVSMGDVIKEKNKKNIVAVGFDNNTQVVDYLETGVIDAIAVQNQFAMGYLGAQYAIDLIKGKKVKSEKIDTGISIITRENMYNPDIQTILFPFEKLR